MYKKFALLLLSATLSCNTVTANNEQTNDNHESTYKEFADDYSKLFDEAPGKEWNTRQFACSGGGGGSCASCGGGGDCGTWCPPQD